MTDDSVPFASCQDYLDEDIDSIAVRRELAAASLAASGDFWDNEMDREWQDFQPCPGEIS